MAAYSNDALRLPASLINDVRSAAARDGVSINGFVVQAVAEKVAGLQARGAFGGWSGRLPALASIAGEGWRYRDNAARGENGSRFAGR